MPAILAQGRAAVHRSDVLARVGRAATRRLMHGAVADARQARQEGVQSAAGAREGAPMVPAHAAALPGPLRWRPPTPVS